MLLKLRTEFEEESKERRKELLNMERRLMQKEENIDKKVELIDQKGREVKNQELSH